MCLHLFIHMSVYEGRMKTTLSIKYNSEKYVYMYRYIMHTTIYRNNKNVSSDAL